MPNISVEKMSESTIDGVKNISDLSFSSPWSLSSIRDELSNKNASYIVVKVDDAVAAFGGIWVIAGEASIINIAVHPQFRGKHIGDIIMDSLFKEAVSMGATDMTLEVRVSNIPAINLYKKTGFTIEGTRKNFYDKPREDGHIMWKHDLDKN